jgi:hypothetical protein
MPMQPRSMMAFLSGFCGTNPDLILNGKKPVPRPGTLPGTRSFARSQQAGRGEGLIYNIPSAYFQTTGQNEELAPDGAPKDTRH